MKKQTVNFRQRRAIVLSVVWVLSYFVLLVGIKTDQIRTVTEQALSISNGAQIVLLIAVAFYFLPILFVIHFDARSIHMRLLKYVTAFILFVCAIWIPLAAFSTIRTVLGH